MWKNVIITILIQLGIVLGAGSVRTDNLYQTIRLEGKGIGNVEFTAAITRIVGKGDMFWWFYPTLAANPTTRPTLIWLHGATGISPSFLANFGMFGPYDVNLNKRNDSWVNEYNLLFVDAPLGTGFSVSNFEDTSDVPNIDENVEHLVRTIQSFYDIHSEYRESPLYICGHADGSQLALPLAIRLHEEADISDNVRGVILGNPIVSPASVLTELGFYLEELGYIDGKGRKNVENYTSVISRLVREESYEEAFNYFNSLGAFIDENAGGVALDLNYIVKKLTKTTSTDTDVKTFMESVIAPALGISENTRYDSQRHAALKAFKTMYMKPIIDKVEYILKNTNLTINVYNGNLDAVSNTPGQLGWINNLKWSGQTQFANAPRQTLIFNRLIEGYFKESERLRFYWINVAGQLVPQENPIAIRRVLNRIVN